MTKVRTLIEFVKFLWLKMHPKKQRVPYTGPGFYGESL